jgi:hypothetical protein
MIFQYTYEQVLAGKKTETRRRISPGDEPVYDDKGVIVAVTMNGRKKWVVGRSYAVTPGRTKQSVGRIRITAILREPVQAITETAAQAEGYADRAEFLATWRRIHGEKHAEADMWVIRFELGSG